MKKISTISLLIFIFLFSGCAGVEKTAKKEVADSYDIKNNYVYQKGLEDGYEAGYLQGYNYGQIGYDFDLEPKDETTIYSDISTVQEIYHNGFEKGYTDGYKQGYSEGIRYAQEQGQIPLSIKGY